MAATGDPQRYAARLAEASALRRRPRVLGVDHLHRRVAAEVAIDGGVDRRGRADGEALDEVVAAAEEVAAEVRDRGVRGGGGHAFSSSSRTGPALHLHR